MAEKVGTFLGIVFWVALLFGAPIYSFISDSSGSSKVNASESSNTSDYSEEPSYSEYDVEPSSDVSDYSSSDYEDYESESYDSSYDDYDYGYDSYDGPNYNEYYDASTDLDCADIGYRHYVGSYDPNGLDGDDDGWACESW